MTSIFVSLIILLILLLRFTGDLFLEESNENVVEEEDSPEELPSGGVRIFVDSTGGLHYDYWQIMFCFEAGF